MVVECKIEQIDGKIMKDHLEWWDIVSITFVTVYSFTMAITGPYVYWKTRRITQTKSKVIIIY